MIDKLYIDAAKQIREEYLKNLVYITQQEDRIKEMVNELSEISKKIDSSDIRDEEYYRGILRDVDKMINEANNKIKPYQDKIQQLDDEQRKLYHRIKEKYPNLSDDDLRNQIVPHIIELDKKLRRKLNIN